MNNLPTDLVYYCIAFLENRDGASLTRTCKRFSKYQFATQLKLTADIDVRVFWQRWKRHQRTVQDVVIEGMHNPHLWLIRVPKRVTFRNCTFTLPIDDVRKKADKVIIEQRARK